MKEEKKFAKKATTTPTLACAICTRQVPVQHGERKFCVECGQKGTEVFKAAARLKKAIKIATVIAAAGGNAWDIHDATTRSLAEQLAGVNKSSDATWAMVAVLLAGDDS